MIGLPPTVGFVSKWYLVSGAAAEGHLLAAGVVVLGTLLSAAYLLPIVHAAFLRDAADGPDLHPHGEAPWPMVLASSLTAAGVIVLFLFPDVPLASPP
jgi:multicomponent Na+:H+ antiporter subunit D